jgi:MFS family permease
MFPAVYLLGKRYTVLASLTLFLASNIWAAFAASYSSLLATRIIGGFAAGIVQGIGPMMIPQLFPYNQLGKGMAVYVLFMSMGSSLGPTVAGIIADHLHDWRWLFRITSILLGTNLLSCLAMLPETHHNHHDPGQESQSLEQGKSDEESDPCNAVEHVDEVPQRQPLLHLWFERSFYVPQTLKSYKPYFQYLLDLLLLLITPEIIVTILMWACTIGWVLVASIMSAIYYGSPPFSWSSQEIGLLNLGPFVGLVLGFPLGGPVADKVILYLAKNKEDPDPRGRLVLLLIGGIVSPLGCLLMGLSLQNQWHWIGFAAGWGMLAFGITSSCSILLTYSIDRFKQKAGHVGLVVQMITYLLSFAMTYCTVDWYTAQGALKQFGTMAGVLWVCYLLGFCLYYIPRKTRG